MIACVAFVRYVLVGFAHLPPLQGSQTDKVGKRTLHTIAHIFLSLFLNVVSLSATYKTTTIDDNYDGRYKEDEY